jgi:hypothetical protein
VSLGTPSKLNIKLELFIPPCGCEAPTTTIPSPNSIQRGFSQNKKRNVSANKDSHVYDTMVNARITPEDTKTSTTKSLQMGRRDLKRFYEV